MKYLGQAGLEAGKCEDASLASGFSCWVSESKNARVEMNVEKKVLVVQDMAYAAFLVSRGVCIRQVVRKGRKVSWQFEVSESEAAELESAWPSSPECSFFSTYQTLKGHLKNSTQ